MFDQIRAGETGMKPWAMVVSVTSQAAIAGAVVLVSVVQIQSLDLRGLVSPPPLIAPSQTRPVVRIVSSERVGSGAAHITLATEAPVFRAPSRIPTIIANIVDPPGTLPPSSLGPAIPGARDASTLFGDGVPGGMGTVTIKEPPPPRAPADVKHAERAPLRIGGVVLEALCLHKVMPVYPPMAKATRTQGVVHLKAVIGTDGMVKSLETIDGHPFLVKAALDAVRQWRYRPTLLNGEPVEVTAPIEVRFILAN